MPQTTPTTTADDGVIALQLTLATVAKMLCSAVFVSGRDIDEARENSARHALSFHGLAEVLFDLIIVTLSRAERTVTVAIRLDPDTVPTIIAGYRRRHNDFEADWTAEAQRLVRLGEVARTAVFLGDQGCAIVPMDGRTLGFAPTAVRSALPDASGESWPMGDLLAPRSGAEPEPGRVSAAIDAAFVDGAHTAAVVVVRHGQLVAERYGDGIGPDTQLESWSMGKSLTATLIGVLVAQGLLDIDEPAPVEAWQGAGDPRARITVRDLLQMSSGLAFSGRLDARATWTLGVPDHLYVYSEAADVFDFSIDRPAEAAPGTVGRYRNCDPLVLGYVIKKLVTERLGVDYLTWPQNALFDRIGVRRQVLETDWYGNFILCGFDYGTARNWARLGLLYLQRGLWGGERILPEGWAEFVSTPAPGWSEPRYGGQFWVNRTGEYDLPADAYWMGGWGMQRVFIVPSADLVVVRMGHRLDTDVPKAATNAMLREVLSAITD